MYRFHPVDPALRTVEEWTGHRQPPPPRDPMKTIGKILTLAFLAAYVVWTLVSCSFQVSADGSKSFAIDGEEAAKAIRVLTEK